MVDSKQARLKLDALLLTRLAPVVLLAPLICGCAAAPVAVVRPVAPADVSEFGAVGDGVTDDTAALQRALSSGRPVRLGGNRTYALSRRLTVPSRGGLVGDGTATLVARAAGFASSDITVRGRYKADSSVIDASGMVVPPYTPNDGVTLRGFKLRYEWTEGRYLDGIVARNVQGLLIERVELSGFPIGSGIKVASVRGGSAIRDNVVRDFSSNTSFAARYAGAIPQITGIEVDNDRVNGIGTQGLSIARNRIANLTVGPVMRAAHGYQSDGINVASQHADGVVIEGNVISNVGEGIDMFGVRGRIRHNVVTDAYVFGIKLVHGASYNEVAFNRIERAGLAGIVLSGSASASQGTEHNKVTDNIVTDIDPHGVWAANETACIQLSDNRATVHTARHNRFSRNRLDPGRNGKWVVNVRNNSGGDNDFSDNDIRSDGRRGAIRAGDEAR